MTYIQHWKKSVLSTVKQQKITRTREVKEKILTYETNRIENDHMSSYVSIHVTNEMGQIWNFSWILRLNIDSNFNACLAHSIQRIYITPKIIK
jgi:hypothetical protein